MNMSLHSSRLVLPARKFQTGVAKTNFRLCAFHCVHKSQVFCIAFVIVRSRA